MKRLIPAILLLSLLASCTAIGQKTYDYPTLAFKYPASWREFAEVSPAYEPGEYFFSMHITEDLTVTSKSIAEQGAPGVFFSVASLEHPYEGIEVYLYWMYGMLSGYTQDFVESPVSVDGFKGTMFSYTRRLGSTGEAPWYQFQDIWLDTGPLIYLLSFYAEDLSAYQPAMDSIVKSFRFKEHAPGANGEISPVFNYGSAESN